LTITCTTYIARISQSVRDGDDEGLYDKPDFFAQLHELEHNKATHFPPAVLSTTTSMTGIEHELSSSRKRVNLSKNSFLETYIEDQKDRHEALLTEIKKSNDEKAKMRSVMERLLEKL